MPEASHEAFAQSRAAGVSIAQSARAAGVSRKTGQYWTSGETDLCRAILDRIEYVRANSLRGIPSALELYHKMVETAEAAKENGQYKAAGELYWKLYTEQRDNMVPKPIEAAGELVNLRVAGGEDDPALLLRDGDDE